MSKVIINNGKTVIRSSCGEINIAGNGTVIVNGKVVSGNNYNEKPKNFEKELYLEKGVPEKEYNSISISTSASNVEIKQGSELSIKYAGEYVGKNEPKIETTFCYTAANFSTENFEDNSEYVNAMLTIIIPKTIEILIVNTSSGNVRYNAEINLIDITTMSGNITGRSRSEKINTNTMSGKTEVALASKGNANVNMSSMSGNINLTPVNYHDIKISTSSMSGDVYARANRNAFEKSILTGTIKSMSGNINIM